MGDVINTANMLGLTIASFGLFITGKQINNWIIEIIGLSSTFIFCTLFFMLLGRAIKVKKERGSWF